MTWHSQYADSVISMREYLCGVKIIIGGAHITQEYAKKIGADAARDAVEAVNICKTWVGS